MEKTPVEKSLDASTKDGAAYSVMMGLGEVYVAACAVFLGAQDFVVGLLATVPIFLGACCQLISPGILDEFPRRKPLIIGGAIVQTLAWIPMIAAPFLPKTAGIIALTGGFTLYFAAVHFTIPPWLSLMGDLVPAAVRGRYFSFRNSSAITMQFLAATAGGIGIATFTRRGHEALGFAVIFTGAMLARAVSTRYLGAMSEPPMSQPEEARFTLWQFIRQLRTSNFARFVMFVGFMNASAHFAGSVFTVYLLKVLNYSYWEFTASTTALILVQIVAFAHWGRLADRYGNKQVLTATGIGALLIPVFWMMSTHVAWACVVNAFAGWCWAGFNMSVQNFVLDAVSPPKRARCTAYLNLFTNSGILAGGIGGAIAIHYFPARIGPFTLPYAFWWILIFSFILRGVTLLYFLPRIREVREVPRAGWTSMLFGSRGPAD